MYLDALPFKASVVQGAFRGDMFPLNIGGRVHLLEFTEFSSLRLT